MPSQDSASMRTTRTNTMQRIVVIGSGFAGMWSALGARRLIHAHRQDDHFEVIVISPEPSLVIRPRLYEAHAAEMKAPLGDLFRVTGVHHIQGSVTAIHSEEDIVVVVSKDGEKSTVSYDRLILAAGSHIVRPESMVPGLIDHAFDIDSIEAAVELEQHLHHLATLPPSPARDTVVVCGAGFTGIEIATELPNRLRAIWGKKAAPKVVLVSNLDELAATLGPGPVPVIAQALEQAGVQVKLSAAVTRVDSGGVTRTTGEYIETMTSIWTAGVVATPLTQQIPGDRDSVGRLHVDQDLRVPNAPRIFATGDAARASIGDKEGHYAMMSCQHALVFGRFSGYNAAADLLGLPTKPYYQAGYMTCLDLGVFGAVLTKGWDRQVVMSGAPAKRAKKHINQVMIYPPKADMRSALAQADLPSYDPVLRVDRVPLMWSFLKIAASFSNFSHSIFKH